jgi:4-amino-4-deoxy-L-arabinose transferase-like glycosyltransferase
MSSISQEKSTLEITNKHARLLSRERSLELLGISAIVILAVLLRFTNLDALGYANHYYTAGVKSMLQSWHNFFFAAAEPGGSVTIDKPPMGLWIQVISAYFLGVSGFSVLLPELLAGTISVIVLYHLVRRSFGVTPGLLAALALAITPVVVATDRNNTIDSLLILTLLLATWTFIKATETGKLRFLLLGATLVGIGFNIKMLQAYLPLPAFFALYSLGAKEKIWLKVGKLLLTSLLLLTVSLSWAVAVDMVPADQRPYVGSSSDNSETNLILVYNGIDRLLGMFGRRGSNPGGGFAPPQIQGQAQGQGNPVPAGPDGNSGNVFPQNRFSGNNPAAPPQDFYGFNRNNPRFNNGFGNNFAPQFANRGGAGGGGGFNTGRAGPLRLFVPPLSKEVSWFLPFGIVSAILLAVGSRLGWPLAPKHQALVLWGGWLVTCAIFFSIAGFFHEYYLSMLAPPLAALVGIGVQQTWQLTKKSPWLGTSVLGLSAAGTVAFQSYTAKNFVGNLWWLPGIITLLVIGLGILIYAVIKQKSGLRLALGFTLVTAAIFITSGIWSVLTNLSASQNQSLPSAYSGGRIGPVAQRGLQINQTLLDYLQANTQGMKYLMAVPSSMQGADYVIATGRPVLYMGGFMGQDDVVSPDDLAKLVTDEELRFIYWDANDRGRGVGTNSNISTWVESSCTPVQGFDTSTQNSGAPDGTRPGGTGADSNNRFSQNRNGFQGNMQVSLYDCGGQ